MLFLKKEILWNLCSPYWVSSSPFSFSERETNDLASVYLLCVSATKSELHITCINRWMNVCITNEVKNLEFELYYSLAINAALIEKLPVQKTFRSGCPCLGTIKKKFTSLFLDVLSFPLNNFALCFSNSLFQFWKNIEGNHNSFSSEHEEGWGGRRVEFPELKSAAGRFKLWLLFKMH